MTERGFSVLEKVFADRQVVSLADFLKDDGTSSKNRLPQIFRNAAVIHVQMPECKPQAALQVQPEQQLGWYELTESCDSSLFMRGLKDKWNLPCVTTNRLPRSTCECPFIPHAARSDWEKLHVEIGTKKMKCLLIHCIIFVLVGQRTWLQISGPLDKGCLGKNFPPIFQYRTISKAVKRKREQVTAKAPITSSLPLFDGPSVQRPLKKIRLICKDGKSHEVEFPQFTTKIITPTTVNEIPEIQPVPSSLVPILKKVRIRQGSSLSQTIHVIPVAEPQKDCTNVSIPNEIEKKKTRRWRNKLITKQIVDKRRALNGSMEIPHDEIMYSSSGWTHFSINHPISHSSSNPTLLAILGTSVGGECSESEDQLRSDLPLFSKLIEAMVKNHHRCRYNQIVRRMLADSKSDPQKSFVDASRVYQYIRCIIKKVVPIELLGDQTNQQMFLSNVRRFIEAGKGTSFTLNDLIQSMRTSKCRWFSHLPSLAVKISLLARLIVWLFVGFVKPLIRQHFYATETSYGRNRIFFYTKDVWQKIHHRMLRSICSVSLRQPLPVLEKWTAADPTSQLQNLLLLARLRFVPKKNGARPIMSTKFRNTNRKEVNTARLLLHTITGLYAEGMDAKSTHSLHRKWVDFVERRVTSRNPVYFVHADIEDAFGSINHNKMVDLLRWYARILPTELQVRTFCNVTSDGRRSKHFQVIPYFHRTDPEAWVQQMSPGTVVFHTATRAEKLNTVKTLEFASRSVREVHVVHHGKAEYQLKRGIPQGSRLSSALCHIYYGHMVREHLSEFLNNPDDLLIRVVDDFLYLTASGERARAFHHRIHQGFADYNAYVNIDKSATNLDFTIPINQVQSPPVRKPVWFSFCGLQFHTKTLEIRGDYTKYEGTDIIHCITPSTGEPGQLLLKRLQGISTLKIETIYLDARVNRKPTIIRSMFHACLMAAFRFHAIVQHILMRAVPRHCRGKAANARYLAHTVIKECCSKMVGHISSVRRRKKDVKIILGNTETAWLCYEAFHRKLSRHGKLYTDVLLAVRVLRTEHEKKMSDVKLRNLRSWIGNRIPLSFRRMKNRAK